MSYAASLSRGHGVLGARDQNLVVPMTDWIPAGYGEAPHPNTQLSFPALSHVRNHSKTTRKPRRSSPLAGPALSSVVSLNETTHAPRTGSSFAVSHEADRPLSIRSKSSLGLSRPASIVSVYPPSPPRHRPSTTPTARSKSLINRPPSALCASTETIYSARMSPQGSRGVVHGSSFVSGSLGSRSRASYMSTALAGPSTRPVSVVLEVEEAGAGEEEDAAPSRKSAMLYPKSVTDNSWYIANEYSETPKFSRLGLAASNVVMPVSAKERRKQLSRKGSVNTSPGNDAGVGFTRASDSKARNGTINLSWGNSRDTTTPRTHKPEWLTLPQTDTQSRRSSLPSPTTFSSAASSASSLPLTPPHSGTSSTPSVASCATACTSMDESEETTKEDEYHSPEVSPIESNVVKRKSVLGMMKTWSGQRKSPSSDGGHSLTDSCDEHGVLSVCSESTFVSSKPHDDVKKGDVDIVVTSVENCRSEATIQVIGPGNGKGERRVGSVRRVWNVLTGRNSSLRT